MPECQIHREAALLQKWLAGRCDSEFLQLAGKAAAVGVSLCCGEALAQLNDFFFPGAAPANFGPATGCGHDSAPFPSR
jgi:hypothetical protein